MSYGYERVFARQVQALGKIGDVLFAFSTSGNSDNVLAAVREAMNKACLPLALPAAMAVSWPNCARFALMCRRRLPLAFKKGIFC